MKAIKGAPFATCSAENFGESRDRNEVESPEVSIWDVDLSAVHQRLEHLRMQGIGDLRTHVLTSPDELSALAAKVQVRGFNEATLRLFHAKTDDQLLNHIHRIFRPGAKDVFLDALFAVLCGKRSFSAEVNFLTLEGGDITAIMSHKIQAGDDSFKRLAVTIVDITELKRVQQELIENQELLKETQLMANIGSWELDVKTGTALWSEEIYKIIGIAPQNNVGPQFLATILHPDDRDKVMSSLNCAVNDLTPHHIKYRIFRPDGDMRWIECRALQKFDREGQLIKLRGVIQDITESKQVQQALIDLHKKSELSELKLRTITGEATEGITVADARGRYSFVNPAFCSMLGYTEQELLHMSFFDVKVAQHEDGVLRTQLYSDRSPLEVDLQRKGGDVFTAEVSAKLIEFDGQPRVLGIVRDISDRIRAERALRASEQRFDLAMQVVNDGIWDWYLHDNTIYFDARCFSMAGYCPGAFADELSEWTKRTHAEDVAIVEHAVEQYLSGESSKYDVEFRFLRADGEYMWIRSRGMVVERDKAGNPSRFVGTHSDISLLKEREKQILHQAHYDALTELPNRFLTLDRLSQLIHDAQRDNKSVGVLFLDLDGFKKVNDSHGHEVGDKLLMQTAVRLRKLLRHKDTVGRLGGDEFLIILGGMVKAADALPTAESILHSLREPFQIGKRSLVLSGSLGIAIYPQDGSTPSDLLRNSDAAMYHSKQLGRNTCSFFTETMNREVSRRLEIEQQLYHALARREFNVLYQAKVDVGSSKIIGAEALLRWNSPVLGNVPSAEFIAVAEQAGLIAPIADFVLSQALANLPRWQKSRPGFRIAVNISATQFRDPDLVSGIRQTLKSFNVSSHCLELEVTEGVLMSDHGYVKVALSELKKLGVTLAMDDFGTGYSSLAHLRRYPFDELKIHHTFIREIDDDPADRELIQAIVAMAHGLNLKVVAEGVETREQLEFMQTLGCDFAQGYLLGRPMSAAELDAQIRSMCSTG